MIERLEQTNTHTRTKKIKVSRLVFFPSSLLDRNTQIIGRMMDHHSYISKNPNEKSNTANINNRYVQQRKFL